MADDLDPDATDDTPPQDNAVIRELREQAKAGKAAQADADAARRELAFVKAGIDPDDAQQGYFVRGYQGDVTAEAIKAAATEAGFLAQATSAPEGLTPAERAAFAATAEAAAAPYTPPPETDIYAEFRGKSLRTTGEPPEQFGHRLADALEAAGQPVLRSGPFREGPHDTGIVLRAGTPPAPAKRL